MNVVLSRLEEVKLRDVWEHEAQDFTPWLAEEENLSYLAETLGLNLELEAQEIGVGDFQADILCKNEDNSWVVIENQLEETDHEHLGKILTYSAGLDAQTVIWIAKSFRDEHLSALDQLNDITYDHVSYFGVEIKVWKIDESYPAPKFEIVSKPNDWNPSTIAINDWKTKYWFKLNKCFQDKKQNFNIRKPGSKNSVIFGIGKPGSFALQATLSPAKKQIGINLLLQDSDAMSYFKQLYENRVVIEKESGEEFEWDEAPKFKVKKVSLFKYGISPENVEDWEHQHSWLAEKLEIFHNVFFDRLADLNPADWQTQDEDDQ